MAKNLTSVSKTSKTSVWVYVIGVLILIAAVTIPVVVFLNSGSSSGSGPSPGPATKYSCNQSNNCVSDENGKYTKLTDCESACGSPSPGPATKYSCNQSNNCVSDENGKYTKLTDCESACGKPPKKCVNNTCTNFNLPPSCTKDSDCWISGIPSYCDNGNCISGNYKNYCSSEEDCEINFKKKPFKPSNAIPYDPTQSQNTCVKGAGGKYYCNWPRLGESGGKCNSDSNCRDVWHPDNICEVAQGSGTCKLVTAKPCTGPSDTKSCQLPTIPAVVPEKCCHAKNRQKIRS